LLVAIVGGSGSGKSWLAAKLKAALGQNVARLSQDNFYRDRSALSPSRRTRLNFDHPRALDWPLLERVLERFCARRPTRVPRYDFKTHSRLKAKERLPTKGILLVDGLWLLRRPRLRRLFSLRVFLDCPRGLRLKRRLARDQAMRGRTRASIEEQFWSTVEPMHARYVVPQKRWADFAFTAAVGKAELQQITAQLRAHMASAR
jgi:uridine kinase